MEIRQLEYFVQIAQQRGFSRAAAHLYIAQSALSRQMGLLEKELGVILMLRTGRGVRLTEAGEVFLARAESIIRQCRQVRQDVAPSDVPRGELSLGMPPSLGAVLASPLLAQMRQRFPHVFVDAWVETSILLREFVLRGKLDLAVIGTADAETVLHTKALASEDIFLVGPASAKLQTGKSVSLAAAAAKPLILTSRPNSIRVLVERALSPFSAPVIAMEVNSVPLLLELVQINVGHTLLPYSAIHAALENRRISASKVEGLSLDWVIATSRERPLSAGACRALELMTAISDQAIESGEWRFARRSKQSETSD